MGLTCSALRWHLQRARSGRVRCVIDGQVEARARASGALLCGGPAAQPAASRRHRHRVRSQLNNKSGFVSFLDKVRASPAFARSSTWAAALGGACLQHFVPDENACQVSFHVLPFSSVKTETAPSSQVPQGVTRFREANAQKRSWKTREECRESPCPRLRAQPSSFSRVLTSLLCVTCTSSVLTGGRGAAADSQRVVCRGSGGLGGNATPASHCECPWT